MSVRLLSTKSLPATLLATAADNGIDIHVTSFIQITPVSPSTLPPDNTAVIFTSANAVNNVKAADAHWQIYCLGGATLEAVISCFPHSNVLATADNATELADLIDVRSAVFFCGSERRPELPAKLAEKGIKLQEIVVYTTTEVPTVTTNDYDGIFFFSPSAVRSYFTANTPPAFTVCFAIGDTTAAALKEHTSNRIIINPDVPSAAHMVQTAISYFKNNN
jgi:uroporphyrinogen-III synthase